MHERPPVVHSTCQVTCLPALTGVRGRVTLAFNSLSEVPMDSSPAARRPSNFPTNPPRYLHSDLPQAPGHRVSIGVRLVATPSARAASAAVVLIRRPEQRAVYVAHVVDGTRMAPGDFFAALVGLRKDYPEAQWRGYAIGAELGMYQALATSPHGVRELGILPAKADRFIRTLPYLSGWQADEVHLPLEAPWLSRFMQQHVEWGPRASVDDMVEAALTAYDDIQAEEKASSLKSAGCASLPMASAGGTITACSTGHHADDLASKPVTLAALESLVKHHEDAIQGHLASAERPGLPFSHLPPLLEAKDRSTFGDALTWLELGDGARLEEWPEHHAVYLLKEPEVDMWGALGGRGPVPPAVLVLVHSEGTVPAPPPAYDLIGEMKRWDVTAEAVLASTWCRVRRQQ